MPRPTRTPFAILSPASPTKNTQCLSTSGFLETCTSGSGARTFSFDGGGAEPGTESSHHCSSSESDSRAYEGAPEDGTRCESSMA
jgi:hypothetical protein